MGEFVRYIHNRGTPHHGKPPSSLVGLQQLFHRGEDVCLLCSLFCLWHREQCLAQRKWSASTYGINEWRFGGLTGSGKTPPEDTGEWTERRKWRGERRDWERCGWTGCWDVLAAGYQAEARREPRCYCCPGELEMCCPSSVFSQESKQKLLEEILIRCPVR